jgi:hypothetical protein
MGARIQVTWSDENRDGGPSSHDTLIEAQLVLEKHYPFGHCTMSSVCSYDIRDRQGNIVGELRQVNDAGEV